jgi:hypothetical protein
MRRAELRERARTVTAVASAIFMVTMTVGGAAFAVFMTKLAERM